MKGRHSRESGNPFSETSETLDSRFRGNDAWSKGDLVI